MSVAVAAAARGASSKGATGAAEPRLRRRWVGAAAEWEAAFAILRGTGPRGTIARVESLLGERWDVFDNEPEEDRR